VPLPRVSAVLLAYGAEPTLVEAVDAVLSSTGIDVDVVLVDNGCTSDAVGQLDGRDRVAVVRPGANTGFAGGCNLGAARTDAPLLAFVNGDAIVDPPALGRLAAALDDPSVGLVSGSVRLADRPELVNSAGNPVHFSGLSWAGGLGEPASSHAHSTDVASVSGAAMMVRRDDFEALGGFNELMFAYLEDAELSLRTWARGLRCVYVPDSVVMHHYEFSRNPAKMYLLERNRLILLATLYERRTLLLLWPALLGLELALLLLAARQGWLRQKLAGYRWLLAHRAEVTRRRRLVQSTRRHGDEVLAPLLTGDVAPGPDAGMSAPRPARWLSRAYWRLVRRALS
jgi:GT2 family glycosyltransferase